MNTNCIRNSRKPDFLMPQLKDAVVIASLLLEDIPNFSQRITLTTLAETRSRERTGWPALLLLHLSSLNCTR